MYCTNLSRHYDKYSYIQVTKFGDSWGMAVRGVRGESWAAMIDSAHCHYATFTKNGQNILNNEN